MTTKKALMEAKKRFGERAVICRRSLNGRKTYIVGRFSMGMCSVGGSGNSWEEAFKNSDEKEAKYGRLI